MKKCPECSGPLVNLISLNAKKCADCKIEFEWNLKPGQKSVLIEGLEGGLQMEVVVNEKDSNNT